MLHSCQRHRWLSCCSVSGAKTRMRTVTAILALSLNACGGSSSGGGSNSSLTPDDLSSGTGASDPAVTLPGRNAQPNIRMPDIVVDNVGRLHVVMADIDGQVFYGRCDARCEAQESWDSLTIMSYELESGQSAVPKIQVTSDNEPRVMVYRTNQVFGADDAIYLACFSQDCLQAGAWNGNFQEAFTPYSVVDWDLDFTDAFVLNNQNQPRVAWLSTPSSVSFEDDAVFIASCDTDCATTGQWTRTSPATFDLAHSRLVELEYDSQGSAHLVLANQTIGSTAAEINYMLCTSQCDSASAQWRDPIHLVTIDNQTTDHLIFRLILDLNDKPLLALYDEGGSDSIVLYQCTGDCSSLSSWQASSPISSASFGDNIAYFGDGLDVAYVEGRLTLQFIAKRREDLFSSQLYRASCSGACDASGNWQLNVIADTSGQDLSDNNDACVYIGTEIDPPTTIAGNAATYEEEPWWHCGSSDYILVDGLGNRELNTFTDNRFFEKATVTLVE